MVEVVKGIGPGKLCVGFVDHDGVIVKTVPQLFHQVDKFCGARVALGMEIVAVAAKVARLGIAD